MRGLPAAALLIAVAGCTDAPGAREAEAAVAQFHAAVNAADVAAIDALLARSARELRPGVGTARAFAGLTQRHGRYQDGQAARIDRQAGRTRVVWQARYEHGPVREVLVLIREAGAVKIESYTDNR